MDTKQTSHDHHLKNADFLAWRVGNYRQRQREKEVWKIFNTRERDRLISKH